jgi:hypothetical protein
MPSASRISADKTITHAVLPTVYATITSCYPQLASVPGRWLFYGSELSTRVFTWSTGLGAWRILSAPTVIARLRKANEITKCVLGMDGGGAQCAVIRLRLTNPETLE